MNDKNIVVKEKDTIQELADFITRMILKYSGVVCLDDMLDSNIELYRREIKEQYRIYMKQTREMRQNMKIIECVVK